MGVNNAQLFELYAGAVQDGGDLIPHQDASVDQFFMTPEVSAGVRARIQALAGDAKILLANWLRDPIGDLSRLYYYGPAGNLPEELFDWYQTGIADLPNKGNSEDEYPACCLLADMVAALAYGQELTSRPEDPELKKLQEVSFAARELCAKHGLSSYTLTMIKRWLKEWREVEALRESEEYWEEYTANSGYKALLLSNKGKTASAKRFLEAWRVVAGGLFTAAALPDPVLIVRLVRTAISRGF